jgi:glycosyltransferase involved in cell wall biosynthesis
VPDGAGFKIPPRDRPSIVEKIAEACSWVAQHPDESLAMGLAARRYALEQHDWGRIRAEISRAYAEVLADEPPGDSAAFQPT